MDISVIIPCFKDDERLANCLDRLAQQKPGPAFETIVINNHPETPIKLNQEYPLDIKIINESKIGSFAARNAGIKIASGEILAFTDADCLPSKSWLSSAWHILQNTQLDRLTGPVNFVQSHSVSTTERFESMMDFKQYSYFQEGWATTANLFVRKTVFEKVGLFNELYYTGEDRMWNHRAFEFPFGFFSELKVEHPHRTRKQYLAKIRRTYFSVFDRQQKTTGQMGLLLAWIKLLMPPIKYWMLIYANPPVKGPIQLIKLFVFCYYRKLCLSQEHMRLFFNLEPKHQ